MIQWFPHCVFIALPLKSGTFPANRNIYMVHWLVLHAVPDQNQTFPH